MAVLYSNWDSKVMSFSSGDSWIEQKSSERFEMENLKWQEKTAIKKQTKKCDIYENRFKLRLYLAFKMDEAPVFSQEAMKFKKWENSKWTIGRHLIFLITFKIW